MVKSLTKYEGGKHCQVIHQPSQSSIETDAPVDNQGKGEKFSPTDLVGAALGSCILTTVAIACEKPPVSFKGAFAEVSKEMLSNPRRIFRLNVVLNFPAGIPKELRPKIEQIAHTCPVHASLHPDIEVPLQFVYAD